MELINYPYIKHHKGALSPRISNVLRLHKMGIYCRGGDFLPNTVDTAIHRLTICLQRYNK